MLLCIDVGNTNITLGVYYDNKLLCIFRMETKEITVAKKMYDDLVVGLNQYNLMIKDITYAIVDSVVDRIDDLLKIFFSKIGVNYYFVDANTNLGITIELENKNEVGSDILVGLYQASIVYSVPVIVVDMGTATTIILLSEKKVLVGGAIAPGAIASLNNLIKDTSKLSKPRINVPNNAIGKNTIECLQSGIFFGTVCEVNGLVDMMKEESGYVDIKIVVTGGIAALLHPYIKNAIYDENLLIDGLNNIYHNVLKK